MTISKDLLLAILSMDSYNRGYGAGISDGGENDPDGLGESGFIGSARIVARSNDIDYQEWQDAGFYAIAYDTEYGTVISYRGTDFFPTTDLATDAINGWFFAAGDFRAPQFELSTQFLKEVAKNGGEAVDHAFADDIILTGHSLGGGLAGLNSRLYGQKAVIFDNGLQ